MVLAKIKRRTILTLFYVITAFTLPINLLLVDILFALYTGQVAHIGINCFFCFHTCDTSCSIVLARQLWESLVAVRFLIDEVDRSFQNLLIFLTFILSLDCLLLLSWFISQNQDSNRKPKVNSQGKNRFCGLLYLPWY
jgi:hypothetical protein